jgi:hypothetical protein
MDAPRSWPSTRPRIAFLRRPQKCRCPRSRPTHHRPIGCGKGFETRRQSACYHTSAGSSACRRKTGQGTGLGERFHGAKSGSHSTLRWRETDSNHRSLIEGSSGSPQSRQPSQTGICGAVSEFGESVQKGAACCMFRRRHKANPFRGIRTKPVELDAGLATGEIRGPGIETYSRPEPIRGFVKRRFALPRGVGERDPGIHAAVENRTAPFPGGSNRLHDS